MRPSVSFLVATYNRVGLVQQCVRSILEQTYENIEIIVIDDASTDGTESSLKAEFGEKIKYLRNNINRGVAYSRNFALGYAGGKYIGLLDSDDLLLDKDHVRNVVKNLEDNPQISMVACDVYCLDLEGAKVYEKTFFQTVIDHRDADLSSGIKDFEYVFCHGIHSCGAVFRKDITKEIGFLNTNYKIAWDEDFFLRLAACDKFKIYYQNCPSAGYRLHNSSFSRNLSELYREKIRARKNIIRSNISLKFRLGRVFKKRMANQYYCLSDAYLKEKRPFYSLFAAFKAIIIDPSIILTGINKISSPRRNTSAPLN